MLCHLPANKTRTGARPTEALSNYTNTVIGLVQATAKIAGKLPTISRTTGEPEYEGRTADILAWHRRAAGVQTFDQAIALCWSGGDKNTLRVVEMPSHELSMSYLVADLEKTQKNFWMPRSHLDLAK